MYERKNRSIKSKEIRVRLITNTVRHILSRLVGLVLVLCWVNLASAQQKSASDVYVKGYTRSDGTYVRPHWRSAPNGTKVDNFSTEGNVNPYTGKPGWIPLNELEASDRSYGFESRGFYTAEEKNDPPWILIIFGTSLALYMFGRIKSSSKDQQIKETEINSISIAKGPNVNADTNVDRRTCVRCNGKGYIPRFKHINNGMCFKCRGKGFL